MGEKDDAVTVQGDLVDLAHYVDWIGEWTGRSLAKEAAKSAVLDVDLLTATSRASTHEV